MKRYGLILGVLAGLALYYVGHRLTFGRGGTLA